MKTAWRKHMLGEGRGHVEIDEKLIFVITQ